MTPEQYKALRVQLGTQIEAAERLGVSLRTIKGREAGDVPISREAELAIRALVKSSAASRWVSQAALIPDLRRTPARHGCATRKAR